MSIIIKDETANAVVLTIDNNGNMCFGDGTPINRLTLDGYGIIDSNGFITHGVNSGTLTYVSGSVNVGIQHVATISTLAGRMPTVQLDTQYPAMSYALDFDTSTDPPTGVESSSPQYGQTVHTLLIVRPGNFAIVNNNNAALLLRETSSQYYDSSLATAECGYRWL